MLGRLLSRKRKPEAEAPADTVVYAVGDIHGHLDLLVRLQYRIKEDMARRKASRKVVIYLGDYVDRGPESRNLIDHLIRNPLDGFESIHLAGNHERWMVGFLNNPDGGRPWLRWGGAETMHSYGVPMPNTDDPASLAAASETLAKKLPASHRRFLENLPLCHTEGDYFFTHAGVRPGVPLDEQSDEDLTWIREEFLYSKADFGKMIVHGHTPTHTPEEHRNRIAIDTGAYMSGILTAVALEGSKRTFFHS